MKYFSNFGEHFFAWIMTPCSEPLLGRCRQPHYPVFLQVIVGGLGGGNPNFSARWTANFRQAPAWTSSSTCNL